MSNLLFIYKILILQYTVNMSNREDCLMDSVRVIKLTITLCCRYQIDFLFACFIVKLKTHILILCFDVFELNCDYLKCEIIGTRKAN